jgi:predicted urease superfamily metal-dependent hydrolase
MPASELGPLQRTPHFDASTPYHMAVLLYLCNERHGGTGFYRHNATGLQQITESTREHYLDVYYQEINAKRPAQRYFDDSTEQFQFLGMIPAKFNRLVMYHGSLLHTACINPAISITDDPRKGRLTVNTFYDF